MFDTKPKKIALAALTIWPIVYIGGFFLYVVSNILILYRARVPETGMPAFFPVLMVLHCGTMADMLFLAVVYVVHAIKNPSLKQDMRIIWVILILLGGIIAMPVYWYLYIWRSPKPPAEGPNLNGGQALY